MPGSSRGPFMIDSHTPVLSVTNTPRPCLERQLFNDHWRIEAARGNIKGKQVAKAGSEASQFNRNLHDLRTLDGKMEETS